VREGKGGERGKRRDGKKVGTPHFLDEIYAPVKTIKIWVLKFKTTFHVHMK